MNLMIDFSDLKKTLDEVIEKAEKMNERNSSSNHNPSNSSGSSFNKVGIMFSTSFIIAFIENLDLVDSKGLVCIEEFEDVFLSSRWMFALYQTCSEFGILDEFKHSDTEEVHSNLYDKLLDYLNEREMLCVCEDEMVCLDEDEDDTLTPWDCLVAALEGHGVDTSDIDDLEGNIIVNEFISFMKDEGFYE